MTGEDDSSQTGLVDLSEYSIFDIDGIGRVDLQGEFTADSLGDRLVEQWIPYFECDHCGRSDYCKYTIPHEHRAGRLQDIKCGVIVDALKKYVQQTFGLLQNKDRDQIQSYLDGAFHLEQFLYDAEQTTGMLISDGFLKWMGDYVPSIYGRTTHLREHLNRAASEFQKIPEFLSQKGVLFVEGWAEQAFLEKLRESRSTWFTDLKVEVYQGKANKKPNRIQMLLERYVAEGYVIYIQGDGDGSGSDIFHALVQKGAVNSEHTFTFRYDFESSFPPRLLFSALRRLGELQDVEADDFAKALAGRDRPVAELVMSEFELDIYPLKIELAVTVADILNQHRVNWIQNEAFMSTELGKFLMFLMQID